MIFFKKNNFFWNFFLKKLKNIEKKIKKFKKKKLKIFFENLFLKKNEKNLKNKFWKEENIKKLVCKKIYKNRF